MKHSIMNLDARYTIQAEGTGEHHYLAQSSKDATKNLPAGVTWVGRFCGDWTGVSCPTIAQAREELTAWHNERVSKF